MPKTWFITGATRGFGVAIAHAAMQAGDRVIATGRRRCAVTHRLGADSDQLLSVELDVADAAQARSAVAAGAQRFGGIDVLVNNAGYGHLGYFEEASMEEVQAQFSTNVFGVFNVTWAVLPLMRAAHRGMIFNMSSVAGLRGNGFTSLYTASKFALEGFSESLANELEPFGIHVTIIEPGPFRTDFLAPESVKFGQVMVADYDARRDKARQSFETRNGNQPGDPARLAAAIVQLAAERAPPMRFAAGGFAVNTAQAKFTAMQTELEKWRQMSVDTDFQS